MVNMNSPKPRASSSRQRPSCLHYSHIDDTLPLPPSLCTHNAPNMHFVLYDERCVVYIGARVHTGIQPRLIHIERNNSIVLYTRRSIPCSAGFYANRRSNTMHALTKKKKKQLNSNLCSRLNVKGIFSATPYLPQAKLNNSEAARNFIIRIRGVESQTENVLAKITMKMQRKIDDVKLSHRLCYSLSDTFSSYQLIC